MNAGLKGMGSALGEWPDVGSGGAGVPPAFPPISPDFNSVLQ
jgi:hypothetical protein